MLRISTLRPPLAGSLLLLAAACQQGAPAAPREQRTFSAEDKRVARLLSLGSGQALDDGASPLEQATRCRYLVADLRSQLEEKGALNSELAQALGMVRDEYERRIRAAGGGSAAGEAKPPMQELDEAERAQKALGCIERLRPAS